MIIAGASQQQANRTVPAPAGGITHVGSSYAVQSANTTNAVPSYSGISYQANDVALIFGVSDAVAGTPVLTVGQGWSKRRQDNETAGRDLSAALFYKVLTGTETDPELSTTLAEEHSASLHVFRGVNTANIFDVTETYLSGTDNVNPTNAAITTENDDSALVLFHASGLDDIADGGAGVPTTPSGLFICTAITNPNNNNQQVVACKENVGVADTYTPTAWTHTAHFGVDNEAEHILYTVALRAA